MRHLSVNLPDEMFERIQVLLSDRIRKNPQNTVDRTDIIHKIMDYGLKVAEAEAYSGIQLMKEIHHGGMASDRPVDVDRCP